MRRQGGGSGDGDRESGVKSPSEYSCRSYEMWVGGERAGDDQLKEKVSLRSEYGESVMEGETPRHTGRTRRVSK